MYGWCVQQSPLEDVLHLRMYNREKYQSKNKGKLYVMETDKIRSTVALWFTRKKENIELLNL